MNQSIFLGRATSDPEVRYSTDGKISTARYRLAVRRNFKNKEGNYESDFLNFVAFGSSATYAERYLRKGSLVSVRSRATSGSYTNKEGIKVFYTEFVVEEHEVVNSTKTTDNNISETGNETAGATSENGFANIPDGMDFTVPFTN